MQFKARSYQGADDLKRLQQFNAEHIAKNSSGWLQPGDIPHRLYNVNRRHKPDQLIRLWEDQTDTLVGWAFAYPPNSFDIQTTDESVFEQALDWIEATLTADTLKTELFSSDDPRQPILLRLRFEAVADARPYYETVRDLRAPIAESQLPAGFRIRCATGIEDAEQLAAVHAGAFGSEWTAESYARVMLSPGYAPEREFVVVAPDHRFAAFALTWHDELNKTGYFEPVGTHRDFRRMGLARALMNDALRHMHTLGLETAIVAHESPEDNPASAALYSALGFRVRYTTHLFQKPHKR